MKQLFFSHVEEDSHIGLQLANAIEKIGYSIWCYEKDSIPLVSYLINTRQAIGQSNAIIVLISPQSMASHEVDVELEHAHEQAKPIVPVLFGIGDKDYKRKKPLWAQIVGTSTSIVLTSENLDLVAYRIALGLNALNIKPNTNLNLAEQKYTTSHPVPLPENVESVDTYNRCLEDRPTSKTQINDIHTPKHSQNDVNIILTAHEQQTNVNTIPIKQSATISQISQNNEEFIVSKDTSKEGQDSDNHINVDDQKKQNEVYQKILNRLTESIVYVEGVVHHFVAISWVLNYQYCDNLFKEIQTFSDEKSIIKALVQILRDEFESFNAAWNAIILLTKYRTPDGLKFVSSFITRKSKNGEKKNTITELAHKSAVDYIWSCDHEKNKEEIKKQLMTVIKDCNTSIATEWALSHLKEISRPIDLDVKNFLLSLAQQSNVQERKSYIFALEKFDLSNEEETIWSWIADPDEEVRRAGIFIGKNTLKNISSIKIFGIFEQENSKYNLEALIGWMMETNKNIPFETIVRLIEMEKYKDILPSLMSWLCKTDLKQAQNYLLNKMSANDPISINVISFIKNNTIKLTTRNIFEISQLPNLSEETRNSLLKIVEERKE